MFSEEEVCYECCCTVVDGRDCLELTTWVYLGFVKQNFSATSCDVPYHFYQFAKFEDFCRWKQNPETKLPSINLTSKEHVQRKFVGRQAMVDSATSWHNYLLETETDE